MKEQAGRQGLIPQILKRAVGFDQGQRIFNELKGVDDFPGSRSMKYLSAGFVGFGQFLAPRFTDLILEHPEGKPIPTFGNVLKRVLVDAGVDIGAVLLAAHGEAGAAALAKSGYNLGAGTIFELRKRKAEKNQPPKATL